MDSYRLNGKSYCHGGKNNQDVLRLCLKCGWTFVDLAGECERCDYIKCSCGRNRVSIDCRDDENGRDICFDCWLENFNKKHYIN